MKSKGINARAWFYGTSFHSNLRTYEEREAQHQAAQYDDPTLCKCGARRDEHEYVDFAAAGCPEKGCGKFEEAE